MLNIKQHQTFVNVEEYFRELMDKEKIHSKKEIKEVGLLSIKVIDIGIKSKGVMYITTNNKYLSDIDKIYDKKFRYIFKVNEPITPSSWECVDPKIKEKIRTDIESDLAQINDSDHVLTFKNGITLKTGSLKDEMWERQDDSTISLADRLRYAPTPQVFVNEYYTTMLTINSDRFFKANERFMRNIPMYSELMCKMDREHYIPKEESVKSIYIVDIQGTVLVVTPLMAFASRGGNKNRMIYDLRKHTIKEAKELVKKTPFNNRDILLYILDMSDLRRK